jgi:hypothetical protein
MICNEAGMHIWDGRFANNEAISFEEFVSFVAW